MKLTVEQIQRLRKNAALGNGATVTFTYNTMQDIFDTIEAQQQEIEQHINWNEAHTKARYELVEQLEKAREALMQFKYDYEHGEKMLGNYLDVCDLLRTDTEVKEITKAETEGRLVVLPCKVGDTIYYIAWGTIIETVVKQIRQDGDGEWWIHFPASLKCDSTLKAKITSFGDRLFLVREAAKTALKEGDSP